jgi:DNA-3-methyladenine glycosylase II
VAELVAAHPELAAVVETWPDPPFWHRPPGFATLVLFILEQQVSLASARAAYERLQAEVGEVSPEPVVGLDDQTLRRIGFSRQKTRYTRALAAAVLDRTLDLESISRAPDDDVRRALVVLPGIGPWTADVYLLSCLRRPDVWPVGDRALQVAAAEVLALDHVPDPTVLLDLGERWAPHRSTAARLLWHAYLRRRGRNG